MIKYLQENKTIAIVLVLVIVLVLYLKFGRKEKAGDRKKNSKNSKSRKSGKSGKSGKSRTSSNGRKKAGATRRRASDEENPPQKRVNLHNDIDSSDSSSSSEDDDIRADAQDLYNIVHDDMCSGMQQSEFEQAVDDLADAFVFIELRQLYNNCLEKNMDPDRAITVDDYVKILKQEE